MQKLEWKGNMCAFWKFLDFDMIFYWVILQPFQQFLSLIVLIYHSHSALRQRSSAMTITRGPHYVGQHVLQYEYTCLLMDISDRSENSFTMFFDPQNIGLKTCYMQLSLILAEPSQGLILGLEFIENTKEIQSGVLIWGTKSQPLSKTWESLTMAFSHFLKVIIDFGCK